MVDETVLVILCGYEIFVVGKINNNMNGYMWRHDNLAVLDYSRWCVRLVELYDCGVIFHEKILK